MDYIDSTICDRHEHNFARGMLANIIRAERTERNKTGPTARGLWAP